MGKTLQELQKENKRLLNEANSRSELVKIGEERLRLQQQNQRLLKQLRRGPTSVGIRQALGVTGRTFFKVGKTTGRGLFKAGKTIGKGLIRYGNFLEKQAQKTDRRERSLKKTSKSRPRKVLKRR